jgi:hypothetical protein
MSGDAPSVTPLLVGIVALVLAMAGLGVLGALMLRQHETPPTSLAPRPPSPAAAPPPPRPASSPITVVPEPAAAPGASGTPAAAVVRTARVVGSDLDAEGKRVARAEVEAHLDELRACYARALHERPALHGEASFIFHTSEHGAVESVVFGGDLGADPVLRPCVMDTARRLRFEGIQKATFIYVLGFGE